MSDKMHDRDLRTRAERRKLGKALRKQVLRRSHGAWSPAPDRPDPIDLLRAQDEGRIQQLLPIKYGRMLASPFAFLRGSAAVMASDLATTPVTCIQSVLCGDAHLSNFGVFATPERKLVFDINGFDESYPGPWEWDLKRLAASAAGDGRENGFSDKKRRQLTVLAARAYRKSMGRFARARTLDVWDYHVEADAVLELFDRYARKAAKKARKTVAKARTKTHEQTLEKITELVNGQRQIVNDPSLLVRLSDVLTEDQNAKSPRRTLRTPGKSTSIACQKRGACCSRGSEYRTPL
jgi:hypothetical protein